MYFPDGIPIRAITVSYTHLTPGETALLPNPVFSGHIFSGWYKDSDLKIPATVVKFPNEKMCIRDSSYDRATDLESIGYKILTMPKKQWSRINSMAA